MKQTTFASAAWDMKGKVTRRERSQTKADPDSLAASASVAGSGVRRERRRFPVGGRPTRQVLQPEATGATVEVTKRLKPSGNACHDLVTARVCRPQRE